MGREEERIRSGSEIQSQRITEYLYSNVLNNIYGIYDDVAELLVIDSQNSAS